MKSKILSCRERNGIPVLFIKIDITDFRARHYKPFGSALGIPFIQLDADTFRKICPVNGIINIDSDITCHIPVSAQKPVFIVFCVTFDVSDDGALIFSGACLNIEIRNSEHRVCQRIDNRGFPGLVRACDQGGISDFKMRTGINRPVCDQHILQRPCTLHRVLAAHSSSSVSSSASASCSASVSRASSRTAPAGALA